MQGPRKGRKERRGRNRITFLSLPTLVVHIMCVILINIMTYVVRIFVDLCKLNAPVNHIMCIGVSFPVMTSKYV